MRSRRPISVQEARAISFCLSTTLASAVVKATCSACQPGSERSCLSATEKKRRNPASMSTSPFAMSPAVASTCPLRTVAPASPAMDSIRWPERWPRRTGRRCFIIGTCVGNVTEALDAGGLAEDIANPAMEGEGFLIAGARSLVVGTCVGNVAEAPDAVGLANDSATRRWRVRAPHSGCAQSHKRKVSRQCHRGSGWSWPRRGHCRSGDGA